MGGRRHGQTLRAVSADGTRRQTRVAIVGSGFGGLGAAIRLKQERVEGFVVLERGGEVGGTWRGNTYPLRRLVRDFDLAPHIRFDAEVCMRRRSAPIPDASRSGATAPARISALLSRQPRGSRQRRRRSS